GLRPHGEGPAYDARPAGLVLDHDSLTDALLHHRRQDASRNVGQAAGGERHDERDRPVRVVLRLRNRGPDCAHDKRAEQSQSQMFHNVPLLLMQITSMNRNKSKPHEMPRLEASETRQSQLARGYRVSFSASGNG